MDYCISNNGAQSSIEGQLKWTRPNLRPFKLSLGVASSHSLFPPDARFWSHSLFFFLSEMKIAVLSSSFALFAATAQALKFPVSRQSVQRRSGSASTSSASKPHVFASLPNALPDSADLGYELLLSDNATCAQGSLYYYKLYQRHDLRYQCAFGVY